MEIWRDISGYEGHYQASTYGNIRSIKHGEHLLKGDYQKNGYRRVYLWKNNGKKNCLVHRLVAETFLENSKGCTDVNHKDENIENNCIENLEWCDHRYNMNYGSVKQKISKANSGRIISDETKQKLREDTCRRRWVNNGAVERYVYIDELLLFLSDGWAKGRIKRSA